MKQAWKDRIYWSIVIAGILIIATAMPRTIVDVMMGPTLFTYGFPFQAVCIERPLFAGYVKVDYMFMVNVMLLSLPFILHRVLPGRQKRWQNRIREVLFYLLFVFVTVWAIWYVHGWRWGIRSFYGWCWVAWWGIWLLAYLFILPDVLKLLSKMFCRSAWNRKILIRLGAAILFVVILAVGLYFLAVHEHRNSYRQQNIELTGLPVLGEIILVDRSSSRKRNYAMIYIDPQEDVIRCLVLCFTVNYRTLKSQNTEFPQWAFYPYRYFGPDIRLQRTSQGSTMSALK